MKNCERFPGRLRLAASIGLVFSAAASAAPLQGDTPVHWVPGDHRAVASLFQALAQKPRRASVVTGTTLTVSSCADDGGIGTLRSVVSVAGDGDTVDMSGLTCGPVTLVNGVIPVYANSLTVQGRSALDTVIDGNNADRVFVQYGATELRLNDLTVRNGLNQVSGLHVAGGACILAYSLVTLDHATVTNCTSIGEGSYGGGVLSTGLAMYRSTLSGNVAQGSLLPTLTASYGGGAFAYRGTASIVESTLSGNRAVGDPAAAYGTYDTGAGLFVDDGGDVTRSTISGNYTDGTGGGIATHAGMSISNSTISGNTAKKKSGGGVFAQLFRDLTIDASTIADNTAATGGGLFVAAHGGSIAAMHSTIIADNHATASGDDVSSQYGLTVDGSNNLVMVATNATLPPETRTADPMLLPLADNGGPTWTQAIAATSPARDAGILVAGTPVDQRGVSRLIGPAPDIGAYEYAPDSIFTDGFE